MNYFLILMKITKIFCLKDLELYGILPMYFVATSCQYYTLVGMISSVGGVCHSGVAEGVYVLPLQCLLCVWGLETASTFHKYL